MSVETLHQYKPLPDPDSDIRLAVIKPGAYNDPIDITFQVRNLEDHGPEYEALSYAWGSNDNPSSVHIEAESPGVIAITQNLDIGLRHLRYEDATRLLWIDALCIDQCSKDEKSRQVAAMGKVYSTAISVVIWLGPEQDRSNEALGILQYTGRCVEIDWAARVIRASRQCSDSDRQWAGPDGDLPFRDGELGPVVHLLARPYFRRVWIRQEIALANHAVLYCGPRRVSWNNFHKAIACFRLKRKHYTSVPKHQWLDFDKLCGLLYGIIRTYPCSLSYTQLRHNLGDAECQDPRDKIFAVSALLLSVDQELQIKPDYTRGTEDLYTNIARRILVEQGNMELFASSAISCRILDVPSWTPDWSIPLPWSADILQNWSACAWLTSPIHALNDKCISTTGVAISRVQRVTGLMQRYSGYDIDAKCAMAVEILRAIKPDAERLAARHATARQWTETLCSELNLKIAERQLPRDGTLYELKQYVEAVELVQSCSTSYENLLRETTFPLKTLLHNIYYAWVGLCSFVCDDGSVGLSYPGVREGDQIVVLLGSKLPVILRPRPNYDPNTSLEWELVSVAMIAGLMKGQAIYGDKLPPRWQAISYSIREGDYAQLIAGSANGLYDPGSRILRTDPAEILVEMGIKVDRFHRDPHRLEVQPEELRATGISLQDFSIV